MCQPVKQGHVSMWFSRWVMCCEVKKSCNPVYVCLHPSVCSGMITTYRVQLKDVTNSCSTEWYNKTTLVLCERIFVFSLTNTAVQSCVEMMTDGLDENLKWQIASCSSLCWWHESCNLSFTCMSWRSDWFETANVLMLMCFLPPEGPVYFIVHQAVRYRTQAVRFLQHIFTIWPEQRWCKFCQINWMMQQIPHGIQHADGFHIQCE